MQFSRDSRAGVRNVSWLAGVMALAALGLSACQQKPKIAPITGWQKYQDPYFKLQFSYPQGWVASPEGGKVSLYPSQEAVQKFFDNVEGVEIVISYAKVDSTQPQTLAAYVDSLSTDLANSGYEVNPAATRTIDDSPASVLNYRGRLTEQTYVSVLQAVTIKDSVYYTIKYSALNDLFAPYRAVFDSVAASARLPKAMAAISQADPSLPSPD